MKVTMPLFGILAVAIAAPAQGQTKPDPAQLELFEKRVRPLLAQNCYGCHGAESPQAGLRLDRWESLAKGGPRGAVVVAGDPEKGTLVRAIRYKDTSLMMPPSGRLKPDEIALIEAWIKSGAAMPKSASAATTTTSTFNLALRRKHWAYQPVQNILPPKNLANPIDGFIRAALTKNGLYQAPPADRRTLLRRLSFDITGLPPTPQEIDAFLADKSPNAYEKQVDRLLASPHYGERWGRHWLDLMRYAESLGHEFDFAIPNAYQYRDYVIRAFNADVPYNQFVREHLAGDLLPNPRRNPKTGDNESILATGFFWLGDNTHSPVDVRQDQADRIDRQIDVVGKTFLGQTLACARCHDHKFDPIPTKDYYALYGMFQSSRFHQATLDPDGKRGAAKREAASALATISRQALAERWVKQLATVDDSTLTQAIQRPVPAPATVDLTGWRASGDSFGSALGAGQLVLTGPKPTVLTRSTAHSGIQLTRLEGALRSPSFVIDKPFLHLRTWGKRSRVNIIIDNFEVIRDPIFGGVTRDINNDAPHWETFSIDAWKGQRAYIELLDTTIANLSIDSPPDVDQAVPGFMALDDVRFSDSPRPPADGANTLSTQPLAGVRETLTTALQQWGGNKAVDTSALAVIDALVQSGAFDTASLKPIQDRLVALDTTIPAPVRAITTVDGDGTDERVFVRGNHRAPGPLAPRLAMATCFTEALTQKSVSGSGRLELAERITAPSYPLTARVMVNRLWKHHFGRGIVASTDDFGHMGEAPTNPALLDFLATELIRRGWSVKKMHKLIVMSQTYQQSSKPADTLAEQKDPENKLLHRANVRRLEAEAIRDAMLSVSGRLDPTLYGPSVKQFYGDVADARGKSASGPLDGDGRRTIYLEVRRNFLSPFLLAFDYPIPFTSIGRRTVSNVPAQALALMNGPFVRQQAEVWAERVLKLDLPTDKRINTLYETAFGRLPTADELSTAMAFIGSTPSDKASWTALCHVLFNVKEFVFVR